MTDQHPSKRYFHLSILPLVALLVAISASGQVTAQQVQGSRYLTEKFRLLEEKAEQGDAQAQHELATAYLVGRIIQKDHHKSLEWNFRAAKQGNPDAIRSLKVQYFFGNIPDENAFKWHYLFASVLGLSAAQAKLGDIYRNGKDVPQNYAEALKWYRLAAAQGEYSAQSDLGFMYVLGNGVSQNPREAYIWFSLAIVGANKEKEKYESYDSDDDKVYAASQINRLQTIINNIEKVRDQTTQFLSPVNLASAQQEASRRYNEISKSNQ